MPISEPLSPNRRQANSHSVLSAGGDIVVLGGTFKTVVEGNHTNYTIHSPASASDGLLPSSSIAFDALHSSEQRFPPPNCHPGTRDAVLSEIHRWITSASAQPIFWLYGTAGVGKSAVLQTVCEKYLGEGGRVSASFFFGRGQGTRGRADLLVTTIAYQLAQYLSGYKRSLRKVLDKSSHLVTSSIRTQFHAIIVQAINGISQWRSALPGGTLPVVIVIDGLDECAGDEAQSTIIQLLSDSSRTSNRPLRFLLASRPESHILRSLNRAGTASQTKRVALDDTFKPSDSIRLYFQEQFRDIVDTNSTLWPRVPRSWPGKIIIDKLVENAGGQFLYASLVIAFVCMARKNPVQQLKIVLNTADNHLAFSKLDGLYSQILSDVPADQQDILVRILACIIVLAKPQPVEIISSLISVNEHDTVLCLDQLRAVLSPESASEGLTAQCVVFDHASFSEFLLSERRSGHYAVDTLAWHTYFIFRFLRIYSPIPSKALSTTPTTQFDPFYDPSLSLSQDAHEYLRASLPFHLQCSDLNYLFQTLLTVSKQVFAHSTLPLENLQFDRSVQDFHERTTVLISYLEKQDSSQLDSLFHLVLDGSHSSDLPIHSHTTIHRLLGHLSVIAAPQTLDAISSFLSIPAEEVATVIPHLRLILSPHLNSDKAPFAILCLASFRTFLLDESRSGRYSINPATWRASLAQDFPTTRLLLADPTPRPRQRRNTVPFSSVGYPDVQGLLDTLVAQTRSPKFAPVSTSSLPHAYQTHHSITIFLNGTKDEALNGFYTSLLDASTSGEVEHSLVLHIVWCIAALRTPPSADVVADLVGITESQVEDALYRLRPVLAINPGDASPSNTPPGLNTILVHPSFLAFLKDKDRAQAYALDEASWCAAFVYDFLHLPLPSAVKVSLPALQGHTTSSSAATCLHIEEDLVYYVAECNTDELTLDAGGRAYPSLLSPFDPLNTNSTPPSSFAEPRPIPLTPAEYHRRLVLVLSATGYTTTATLDNLYLQILDSVVCNSVYLSKLLSILVIAATPQPLDTIADYIGCNTWDVEDILYQLRSITLSSALPSLHSSFIDFLTDMSRSQEHYIDRTNWNTTFVFKFLDPALAFDQPDSVAPYSASAYFWVSHKGFQGKALDYAEASIEHHALHGNIRYVLDCVTPTLEAAHHLLPSLGWKPGSRTDPFLFHQRLATVCRSTDCTLLDPIYHQILDALGSSNDDDDDNISSPYLYDDVSALGDLLIHLAKSQFGVCRLDEVAAALQFSSETIYRLVGKVPMLIRVWHGLVALLSSFQDFLLDSERSKAYRVEV